MTLLTSGDMTAMLREATRRGWELSQTMVESQTHRDAGNIQSAEDVLTLAALAEALRWRVERAARDLPGMSAALVALHRRMGAQCAEAERLLEGKRD